MGFIVDIYLCARGASAWFTIGLTYMIIESDDVQTNSEHDPVFKPSCEFSKLSGRDSILCALVPF